MLTLSYIMFKAALGDTVDWKIDHGFSFTELNILIARKSLNILLLKVVYVFSFTMFSIN